MTMYALVDAAVAEALSGHPDYLSQRGKEAGRAHRLIVRKVTKALRESMSAPRDDEEKPEAEPVKTKEEAQPEHWQCEVWSKEWWALVFAYIARGKSTTFLFDYAQRAQKGTLISTAWDEQPPSDLIERMRSYPSDGDEIAAWRAHLARRGVRLPEWRGRLWVFMPAADPSDQTA